MRASASGFIGQRERQPRTRDAGRARVSVAPSEEVAEAASAFGQPPACGAPAQTEPLPPARATTAAPDIGGGTDGTSPLHDEPTRQRCTRDVRIDTRVRRRAAWAASDQDAAQFGAAARPACGASGERIGRGGNSRRGGSSDAVRTSSPPASASDSTSATTPALLPAAPPVATARRGA